MDISSGNCLAPNRRQAFPWNNADPVHWRKYEALGGGGELKYIMEIHYNAGGKWLNWDTKDHTGEMLQTVNNPAPLQAISQ